MFDEAIYVTLARTLATEHYYDYDVSETLESYRPPLFSITIALTYLFLGVGYLQAKVPVILAALAIIIYVFWWTTKKFGTFTGISSAIFLGSSPIILKHPKDSEKIKVIGDPQLYDQKRLATTIIIPADLFIERINEQQ